MAKKSKIVIPPRRCNICRNMFDPKRADQSMCSRECVKKMWGRKETVSIEQWREEKRHAFGR